MRWLMVFIIPMPLTDTHAHLDFPDFENDLDAVIQRALQAGVHRIITIGTSFDGSRRAIALADRFPNVFAAIGVHPNNAAQAPEDVIDPLRELARHPKVVAVGECGLDYHRLPSSRMHESAVATPAFGNETQADVAASLADGAEKQRQAIVFSQQLDLAIELGLNVIVHERDAWDDTLRIISRYTGQLRAVFHCFGRGLEQAQEIFDLGHLVSFTGITTFKNASALQACAAAVPSGQFMVETDCPFLAPAPHRGKRCEPEHVSHTAAHIASLRGESLDQLAAATEETADKFFRFPSGQ
jgi:TatD DNase family protein